MTLAEFLTYAAGTCVNGTSETPRTPEDESDGLHDGRPCERQDGYGDDGQEIRCVLCLAALAEIKRGDRFKPGGGERE